MSQDTFDEKKCQNWLWANHQLFNEMKSEISEVFFSAKNLTEEVKLVT